MPTPAHALWGETGCHRATGQEPRPRLGLFWNEEGTKGMASRAKGMCKGLEGGPWKCHRALVKDGEGGGEGCGQSGTQRATAGVPGSGAWLGSTGSVWRILSKRAAASNFTNLWTLPGTPDTHLGLDTAKAKFCISPPNPFPFFPVSVSDITIQPVTSARNLGIFSALPFPCPTPSLQLFHWVSPQDMPWLHSLLPISWPPGDSITA